ncbi:non-ribosomal peptide synthetase [Streptomyces sp. NBC_00536]|uniref:non-ribosomal peptide synthetase n=1 Tax=Streptomyces sp. NBC_00536 TaxID=2975769 RepID=UPI002E811AA3|nr:non-ribosomal peptide synthetase [Streptomyces sp. NBC_00536]WUC79141.1 non-ribosomal peptide synthetase [Streptomyces sp. NBC_00536]
MNTAPSQRTADLLLRAARLHPDAGMRYCPGPADTGSRDQSHAELLHEALRVLTGLRARGLRPRDKVVLILERPQEFITAFWAAVLGGFVPCPMAPLRGDQDRWAAQLAHVNTLLDGPLVVSNGSLAAELPPVAGLEVAVLDGLYDDGLYDDGQHGAGPYGTGPAEPYTGGSADDTAVLVLTSGSTGNSKAVMLTHANLLASMAAKNGHHRLTAADTTMNWVSFDHVAALLECHLLPLSVGCRQVHVEAPVVLGEPLEFLRLASRHGVTMTFTPNFLLGQLNSSTDRLRTTGERLDLSALRQIISGGEAVVRTTGETFLERFAPYGLAPGALWPAFGMTETCAGSVYSREFPAADPGAEFASLGTPVQGLRLRIAGPDDRPLPPGEVGELQLSGPMITSGYHNNEEATREAFTADGWFRSGDLGRLDDSRLTLVGRSKDSVIVNGVNYFSHELETSLEQLDGVAGSYVAAFPTRGAGSDTEELVVAFHCEADGRDEAGLHRVITAVRNSVVMQWGFRPSLVLALPREAFPKTSLGKIQRALMRRRLETGAYDAVRDRLADLTLRMLGGYTAPEGATERVLAEIYAEMFGVDPASVSATANFFDLGGTSLDILRLRSKVARRLGAVGLSVITVLTAPTVRALAARLTTAGAPAAPREYDPVVPMQSAGTKTPLFCVHPGVGEVLVFVNLAKYFAGDRPFHALRARGFNEGEKPFATFEQMVDCYVSAIRARQPQGPYAVAGYSYGAAVAFEIAKALRAEGERVDFVGSFNLPPHIKYRMDELDFAETAANLALFLDLVGKKEARELPGVLRGLPCEEQVGRLLELAAPERIAELDLDADRFAAWAEVAARLTELGRTFEPSGTVPSMHVFYATPLRGTKQDWLDHELRRWDEHTTGPNRYVEVPGEHYTLMSPRHVSTFQSILRRELDLALGDADRIATARAAAPYAQDAPYAPNPQGENR